MVRRIRDADRSAMDLTFDGTNMEYTMYKTDHLTPRFEEMEKLKQRFTISRLGKRLGHTIGPLVIDYIIHYWYCNKPRVPRYTQHKPIPKRAKMYA